MTASITDAHYQEWLDSGVDAELIKANVCSLSGAAIYDYLFYGEEVSRTNTGRLSSFYLRDYAPLEAGGWWCSGLDPQCQWEPMLWGQFKADTPRRHLDYGGTGRSKLKVVKYEPPVKVATRAYFLMVPDAIAQRVYQTAGVCPSPEDQDQGFWHCVLTYNIFILITEGAKKAGALLTAGYAAIALPGVSSGYRVQKNNQGTRSGKRYLIPDLQLFATPDRQVYICFDHDQKPSTQAAVQANTLVLGGLWHDAGCDVRVIELPGPEKGVDDFIMQRSQAAFTDCYEQALPLNIWRSRRMYQLTCPVQETVHQRYLDVTLPESGLVCIKSPKGTGKTSLLEGIIRQATQTGRKTLVISHRIQLARAICQLLGLDYVSELHQSETSNLLGFGLCIDSLHSRSQAQFMVSDWKGAIVVLDECEQIIWHVLNSTTCQQERVVILETFKALLRLVLSSGGLVIAQDADLSDLSIELLTTYGSDRPDEPNAAPIQPWIVVNTWKPTQAWPITFYKTPDPAALWVALEQAVQQGPVFICMDAQKPRSKWGTVNVEARLQQLFPDKRILRIDSHTVTDPSHPAYGCMAHLIPLMQQYDIVIASPSIGSGISFNVPDYFVAVFGIFQGTIPDSEIRQALARVRQSVPRHVWVRPFGVNRIGNGSTDYQAVVASTVRTQQANLRLLKDVDFDLDYTYDPVTLRTWAKFAARANTSLTKLRDVLEATLVQEGHTVTAVTPASQDKKRLSDINKQQTNIRDRSCQDEANGVVNAADITDDLYQRLQDQRYKTPEERQQEEKYRLQQRYGVEVTADLYLHHQQGWYQQLRLHYYLTHASDQVRSRDRQHWRDHLSRGQGIISPQDVRTYTERVEALKLLGLVDLLQDGKDVHGDHDLVQAIVARSRQWRYDLKTLFRISITENMGSMQIIQALLGLIGVKLHRQRRSRLRDGSRNWIYRYSSPTDGRDRIFEAWAQQQVTPEGHPLDSIDLTNKGVTANAEGPPWSASEPLNSSPAPQPMDEQVELDQTLMYQVLVQQVLTSPSDVPEAVSSNLAEATTDLDRAIATELANLPDPGVDASAKDYESVQNSPRIKSPHS
ncbi:plasmid replication protein, CyRepA1 family [Leptolyngbya sp. CCY15150]|uniref:plasmid replication protein, CyRepA1 family n=1 Tax=Leptolyngbya sp. CCY15150 TaxID=2767772 RepID=UPI001951168B|nr:plasmid replication protein, CyRepA1 family [Leptolyngbya sp. CCY15150]